MSQSPRQAVRAFCNLNLLRQSSWNQCLQKRPEPCRGTKPPRRHARMIYGIIRPSGKMPSHPACGIMTTDVLSMQWRNAFTNFKEVLEKLLQEH